MFAGFLAPRVRPVAPPLNLNAKTRTAQTSFPTKSFREEIVFDVATATETRDVVLVDAVQLPNHPIYRINIIVDTEFREAIEPVSLDRVHGIKGGGR